MPSDEDAGPTMLKALDSSSRRSPTCLAGMTKLVGMTRFVRVMKLIRNARDSKFISFRQKYSRKTTTDKTSSPQRKLGSRPSHPPAIVAALTTRQTGGG